MTKVTAFELQPGAPEQIADYLQLLIVRGELAPGERIAEARVTEALGVSRGPVREALRVLSARHLVDVTPRRGARVTPFGPDDVRGLYDMQISLLSLLATRVAQRLDEPMRAALTVHREAVARAVEQGDTLALLAGTTAFAHDASELIGNVYLRDTLDRLAPAFSRAHYRALASKPRELAVLAGFIDELMESVAEGTPARIQETVRRYGERQMNAVLATFSDAD